MVFCTQKNDQSCFHKQQIPVCSTFLRLTARINIETLLGHRLTSFRLNLVHLATQFLRPQMWDIENRFGFSRLMAVRIHVASYRASKNPNEALPIVVRIDVPAQKSKLLSSE